MNTCSNRTSSKDNAETDCQPVLRARVDIFRQDGAMILLADMTGSDDATTEVTLEQNVLTIRGTTGDRTPEGYTPVWSESRSGKYDRSFTMPREVDADAIEASVRNGVLRIMLPQRKDAGAKRIPLTTA